jgi:hypothetical protein
MGAIYSVHDVRAVHTTLTSGVKNRNWQIHSSVTLYTGGSVLFIVHTEQMVKLILMKSIFN